MEKSESVKELVTALAKAQGEIDKAKKDVTNTFFKSKYADLASVVDAIKEPLSKNGISYTQVSHDCEHAVGIETIIFHSSGEWLSTGKLTVPVAKNDAQGYGSAMTYARRYSLSAAFGVATEEDDGNAAAKAKPAASKSVSADTLETLEVRNPGEKVFLSEQADKIKTAYTFGAKEGLAEYKKIISTLDTDEQVAIWSFFESKQRTFITKQLEAKPLTDAEQLAATP